MRVIFNYSKKYSLIILLSYFIFSCSSKKTESTETTTTTDSTSVIIDDSTMATDSASTMSSDSAYLEKEEAPEEYMKSRITIFNETDSDINLMLGENESSMELVKISKNHNYTSGNYSRNPIVSVRTNRSKKTKSYKLFLGNQYRIVWNSSNKCYEVE